MKTLANYQKIAKGDKMYIEKETFENLKTREQRELAQRLINSWKFHNPETGFSGSGFYEWRPGTPQNVKDLQDRLLRSTFYFK